MNNWHRSFLWHDLPLQAPFLGLLSLLGLLVAPLQPRNTSSMCPERESVPCLVGMWVWDIVEWVEEVRASMRVRHLAPIDQTYFIYDHLAGSAKDEVKYRPKQDREDPEKVLSILQEVYGCSLPYVALQKDFFSRKQLEDESLQEYSHALFELMEKIMRNAPQALPNSAILLRDQFV